MDHTELYRLRETYNAQRILLCFNGPFSQGLIVEIGNALKNYLESETASRSSAFDVFAVYVEIAQNIRRYACLRGYGEADAASTVVVSRDGEGRYVITAGNIVERADGEALAERLERLAGMDKAALKSAYKEQLRKPREEQNEEGAAGLGLIDMARKASAPLSGSLHSVPGGTQYFFSLRVVI
jgi:hypothetical protein